MTAQKTSTVTQEMMTLYKSEFLKRAKHLLVHKEGAQMETQEQNSGKVIRFSRMTPFATVTTPLTEGSNPSEVDVTTANVDVTLAEYGNVVKIAKLFKLTSIDRDAKEKSGAMGQNMGETIDELTRDAMYTGATAQLASSVSALTDVAATDTFDAAEVRKAVRTLEANKALRYSDGFFMGKVGPYTKYDLVGDTVWQNAKTYSDVKDLYAGEIGELYGVRFLLTTNQKTESSTVTVYSNFIHGQYAFGCYDLAGDTPKLYIKVPTASDTSNPTDRYSTIGWAGSYAAKVLIADWLINVKTGATQ